MVSGGRVGPIPQRGCDCPERSLKVPRGTGLASFHTTLGRDSARPSEAMNSILLLRFDPAAGERAFATPRSWQFVSDALKHAPEDLVPAVAAGCVGEGPAAEFVAYRRLCRALPDLDACLASPASAPVPREPAVLYALSGALVERLRAETAPAEAVLAYAARLPEEFALLTLRDALAVKPRLAALPAAQSWIAKARGLGLFPAA